jgi:hypothetical protein
MLANGMGEQVPHHEQKGNKKTSWHVDNWMATPGGSRALRVLDARSVHPSAAFAQELD